MKYLCILRYVFKQKKTNCVTVWWQKIAQIVPVNHLENKLQTTIQSLGYFYCPICKTDNRVVLVQPTVPLIYQNLK